MDDKHVFEGFNPTFEGYSKLPNEWLDEITSQIDNVAELKIVLYVYRHTWGFQEKKNSPDEPDKHDEIKHITTDEFAYGRKRKDGTRMDNGTGLGLTAVKDGIAKAIKHGYIFCETDDRDRARIKKFYGLKMQKSDGRNPTTDSHNPTSNHRNPTSNESDSDQRTEKETSDKNRKRESKKKSVAPNVVSETSRSDSTAQSFHTFTLSSSLSQKPRRMGLIQAPVRDVLRAIADSQDRGERYHFDRVHDLWLKCGLEDINVFRERIYAAKKDAMGGDIEHFYRCLCNALHIQIVESEQ